ncbi:hypothetical protein GYMLUDRAFT_241810 [Collybiopsis luxurians FD-317 M1]|uniref:NACHT domain-containing protein n=1 Tax=Collybiopsis luxurians FD-317 M1 TaxID=944289 RepID=A0A0D0D272_9AGAR|nr:hypothetical protein GYMLUDRAFT_241810 [Collybiopsis luxurians FD-317 M1]
MFSQARGFSIYGGQYIYNAGGTQTVQNSTITYEQIKLKTPTAPNVFTGRVEVIAEAVEKLLQNEPAHLAILGAGGMGKTALALHILRNEEVKDKFKDRIYFVPCEISSDAPSLIQTLVQTLQLSIPAGKTGFEVVESFLVSAQKPILLVLDNFETPWNGTDDQTAVENLIDHLLDKRSVAVILTMRAASSPGTKNWIKLGGESGIPPLKLDEARQAFMLISNSQEEEVEKLDWILNEVDCMPLAILLVAQLRRKQLGLDTLIKKWRDHKTAMLRNGRKESRLTSVAISIDLSLDMLENQNPECTSLLPILSYLPNGLPAWQEELDKLFPAYDTIVEILVVQLLEFALLYQESRSLKILSPIREYVQHRYPADKEHLNQMGKYYVKLLEEFGPCGKDDQDIIELHIANIVKVIGKQLHMTADKIYLHACDSVIAYSKFFPVTVSLIDIALAQLGPEEHQKEINLEFKKEYMLRQMGRGKQARENIERVQVTLQNASLNIPPDLMMKFSIECLYRLGKNFWMENNWHEARKMFLQARVGFEGIGNKLGAAQCLQSLGDISRMENKYSKAREMLAEAKVAFERIGNHLGAVQCLQSLGNICRIENKHHEATKMLVEAKGEFERIGEQLGAAQCLQYLSDISRMENKFPEARKILAEAKVAFERIGNQLGAAQCLRILGEIFWMENKYPEAREIVAEAKLAFERIGNQLGAAQCLRSLGDISRMENKYLQAREMVAEAKVVFERLGNQLGVARCLQSLGNISQMENKYPEAREIVAEAKVAFERIGNQLGAAYCLQSLGNIYQMGKRYAEARDMFVQAQIAFEKIGNQLGAAQCLQSLNDICRMENTYPSPREMVHLPQ